MSQETLSTQEATDAAVQNSSSPPAAPPIDPKQTHIAWDWKNNSPLIACRFDPRGRFVFSSAEDNSIQRWELPSGKMTRLEGHDSWVRGFAFLPDGETMISVGSDQKMIFWPTAAEQPAPLRVVEAHGGWVRCIAVSADGRFVATGGNDNLVKLWNPADGTLIRELVGHDSHVYSTLFHPDNKTLLSGDLLGQVKQWQADTGKAARTFDAKDLHSYNGGQQVHYGGVRGMALSAEGKHLACCGLHKATNPLGAVNEPIVVVFDWETQKQVRTHVTGNSLKGIGWRVVYLANGDLACASGGSGGGFLIFWKPDSDKEFHQFKLPDTARDMDLHPQGDRLATIHYDQHVRICQLTPKAAKA